jgi:hypothetical protein
MRSLKPRFSISPRVFLSAILMILVMVSSSRSALAQTEAEEDKLEREFTDPLTTLPQILIRDAYSPATYGTNVETNETIIRPIIPRIPPYTLLPCEQLVRPTFPLVTVPSSRGGSRTEFGDMSMFDVAVLPWPNRRTTGLLIGVGPTLIFPTATSTSAGQGAWQAGPTLGVIFAGIPGVLGGFVLQNPISFAYTSPKRPPQDTLLVQPVLAVHLWGKWFFRSAEATWSMGWHHHSPTAMPLSAGLGRTLVRPGLPPMSFFVTGQWTVYRQFAPITPQTTVNFGLVVAFPEFRDW